MINIIAIITMLIDHIGSVFFPDIIIFRIIGRLSYPLFAYQITKGYKLTKNFNYYAIRLILLAIVSQIPFNLLFNDIDLNVCFTLFIGLITLKIYDSNLNKIFKLFLIISSIILSQFLHFQYGFYGILTIIVFHIFSGKEIVVYYQLFLTLISIIILKYNSIQLFSVFSSIIILFINILQKNDFKLNKVFCYSFYPIHLFILFLIKMGGV